MHPVDEREAAEREGEGRTQPGPQRREREHARDRGGDRDRPGQRVLAEAEARSAVHERVVERVHDEQQGGDAEDQRLSGAVARHGASASSKNPTTRRSYSSGRAVMPPVCLDSGISQCVTGPFAARA